jgi:hypothetical protein
MLRVILTYSSTCMLVWIKVVYLLLEMKYPRFNRFILLIKSYQKLVQILNMFVSDTL